MYLLFDSFSKIVFSQNQDRTNWKIQNLAIKLMNCCTKFALWKTRREIAPVYSSYLLLDLRVFIRKCQQARQVLATDFLPISTVTTKQDLSLAMRVFVIWVAYAIWYQCYNNFSWRRRFVIWCWWQMMDSLSAKCVRQPRRSMIISFINCKQCLLTYNWQKGKITLLISSALLSKTSKECPLMCQSSKMLNNF